MKYTKVLLGAILISFCFANVFAGMYSWTDENGVKHYSNVAPPQEAEEIVEIQGNNYSIAPVTKQNRNFKNK